MKAFLVLGPESTGTRLMTQILISAGCQGDAGHFQKFDEYIPEVTPIVWRRSYPHFGNWPNLFVMLEELANYECHAIVTVRHPHATERSQVANKHVKTTKIARENVSKAYQRIFMSLSTSGTPFTVIPFESLMLHPAQSQYALFEMLGLSGQPLAIRDENRKHYADQIHRTG